MTELYEQEQALYARELAAEISALPIRHQTVFVCRLQGYTFKEIGEVLLNLNAGEMGVGVERVRHLLFEAKKYIRKTIVEPPQYRYFAFSELDWFENNKTRRSDMARNYKKEAKLYQQQLEDENFDWSEDYHRMNLL